MVDTVLKKVDAAKQRRGLVIMYYGNGKGKTSAAVGLGSRAAGYGMSVLFLQFIKGEWPSGERALFEKLPNVKVKAMGKGFVGILGDTKPRTAHESAARAALDEARAELSSGKYEVVILDEAISAIEEKLLTQDDVLSLILAKPERVHLVLTGHKAYKKIVDACDLVTEMKMVKHPYYEGILAKRGIDF